MKTWNYGKDHSTDITKWFKDPETELNNSYGVGNLLCKVAHHMCYTSKQTEPDEKLLWSNYEADL